jgi:hypothetical protein
VRGDFLAISVPTFWGNGSRYPSVNHMGRDGLRGGRKTKEYHDLFAAVRGAALGEAFACGWKTADYPVEVHLKRYVITRRAVDSANLGKCELDALQSAGIVKNDSLIRLFPDVQYDPTPRAIDRLAIIVLRLFPPAILADKSLAKLRPLGKNGDTVPSRSAPEAKRRIYQKRAIDTALIPAISFAERDEVLKKGGRR